MSNFLALPDRPDSMTRARNCERRGMNALNQERYYVAMLWFDLANRHATEARQRSFSASMRANAVFCANAWNARKRITRDYPSNTHTPINVSPARVSEAISGYRT